MPEIKVSQSRLIPAKPADVYALMVDYEVGHPSILPKEYFKTLTIERGGQGAGTIFLAEMEVMGRKSEFRMEVTEPAPGRLLMETDAVQQVVTTFHFEPHLQGDQTMLTIQTVSKVRNLFRWVLERLFSPAISRKIYRAELELIAEKMKG
jgi:hypothetical protein